MVRGIKQARYRQWKWSSIGILTVFCICCMTACGVPAPPAKPLNSNDTSITIASKSLPTTAVQPIHVENNLSHLVAYPGGQMSITISTNPNALCSLIIDYGRGIPSRNPGIAPSTADGSGTARWAWRVDGDAHTGWWPLTITAVLPNGASTTSQVSVLVAFPPISVVNSQTNLIAAPHGTMALTVATAPGATADLVLNYGPGRPTKFLHTGANGIGIASWTWRVDDTAVVGTWPISVSITLLDGESTATQLSMTVL